MPDQTLGMRVRAQVLLDVASIAPDRILLLDSYFYVVVFHGTSIAQWRKEGYHLQPEHAGFKELLEVRPALAWFRHRLCREARLLSLAGPYMRC